MLENIHYWFQILWEAITASFGSIEQTPGTLLFGLLIALLGIGLVWVQNGFEAMREHIWQNVLGGLAIAAIAWFPFFLFHLAQIPYLKMRAAEARAISAEGLITSAETRATNAEARAQTAENRARELEQQVANKGGASESADKKKREEIRTILGQLLASGRTVMSSCLRTPQVEGFSCQLVADKWYQAGVDYVRANLEPSYLSRFMNASGNGLSYTGADSTTNTILNGVNFRCVALEQFIRELLN